MNWYVRPIPKEVADNFCIVHHRHHNASNFHVFTLGYIEDDVMVGVLVARPCTNRHRDKWWRLEISRVCMREGHPNGCSALLGAAYRAAKGAGYLQLQSYILEVENGVSYKAAGWRRDIKSAGGLWQSRSKTKKDYGRDFIQDWDPGAKWRYIKTIGFPLPPEPVNFHDYDGKHVPVGEKSKHGQITLAEVV